MHRKVFVAILVILVSFSSVSARRNRKKPKTGKIINNYEKLNVNLNIKTFILVRYNSNLKKVLNKFISMY